MINTGYQFFVPCAYFFRWLECRDLVSSGPLKQDQSKGSSSKCLEAIIRVCAFTVIDILITEVVPRVLYGTSDLDVLPSTLKRMILTLVLAWCSMPFSVWLRKRLASPKNKPE